MARITVEKCVDQVPNRFDLVIQSAERTRQLYQGARPLTERTKNKFPVIALREIGEQLLTSEVLRASLIKKYLRVPEIGSEDDIEVMDIMREEQAWINQPESEAMMEEIHQDHLRVEDQDEEDKPFAFDVIDADEEAFANSEG